ncbi:MAG: hypothetical protein Kow0092_06830 [Deferrisomatales bacterium]
MRRLLIVAALLALANAGLALAAAPKDDCPCPAHHCATQTLQSGTMSEIDLAR